MRVTTYREELCEGTQNQYTRYGYRIWQGDKCVYECDAVYWYRDQAERHGVRFRDKMLAVAQ